MKIVLMANRDLAGNYALNRLIRGLSGHRLCVFLSDKIGGKRTPPQGLRDLQAFEQGLGSGRNQLPSFAALGEKAGCAVETLNDVNGPAGLERLAAEAPELIVSIRYGVILKEPAIALPSRGVLNLHSGPLPQYQGVMATFWAMLNGDDEAGTTLHYIVDSGIDTGPVVDRTRLPIDRRRSYLWHVLQLYTAGCDTVLRAVGQLARGGELTALPQRGEARYYTFPTENELKSFADQGFNLFHPDEPLDMLERG